MYTLYSLINNFQLIDKMAKHGIKLKAKNKSFIFISETN